MAFSDDGVDSAFYTPDVTKADVPVLRPQIRKEVHDPGLIALILQDVGRPGENPQVEIKADLVTDEDDEATLISVYIYFKGDSPRWHKQFKNLLILYVTARALGHTVDYTRELLSQVAAEPENFPIPEDHARMFLKIQPTVLLSKLRLKKVENIAGYTLATYLLEDGPTTFEYRVVAIGAEYTDVDLGAKYKTPKAQESKDQKKK
jgi:hypothetical protein